MCETRGWALQPPNAPSPLKGHEEDEEDDEDER